MRKLMLAALAAAVTVTSPVQAEIKINPGPIKGVTRCVTTRAARSGAK